MSQTQTYKAAKAMTLMGRSFSKGSEVPTEVLAEISEGRLRSLKSTGLLREVEFTPGPKPQAPKPEPEVKAQPQPEGEYCPECGEGPFKRLDRHTIKHDKEES